MGTGQSMEFMNWLSSTFQSKAIDFAQANPELLCQIRTDSFSTHIFHMKWWHVFSVGDMLPPTSPWQRMSCCPCLLGEKIIRRFQVWSFRHLWHLSSSFPHSPKQAVLSPWHDSTATLCLFRTIGLQSQCCWRKYHFTFSPNFYEIDVPCHHYCSWQWNYA